MKIRKLDHEFPNAGGPPKEVELACIEGRDESDYYQFDTRNHGHLYGLKRKDIRMLRNLLDSAVRSFDQPCTSCHTKRGEVRKWEPA